MALPEGLLSKVKNYLDMTWTLAEEETEKLTGIIEQGMAYIDFVAGYTQDYTKSGQALALLKDYVRYTRSNALDEFQTNYTPEILTLQMMQEVPSDTESS